MRIVTMEEARNLPPPTPEELAARRRLLDEVAAIRAQILAERGGEPIPWEDIEWALDRGWDDDDDGDESGWK
jgi:hypothetical protein